MIKEKLVKIITLYERMEEEAATRPDILHFIGHRILFLSGKSQGIFKREVGGNHGGKN